MAMDHGGSPEALNAPTAHACLPRSFNIKYLLGVGVHQLVCEVLGVVIHLLEVVLGEAQHCCRRHLCWRPHGGGVHNVLHHQRGCDQGLLLAGGHDALEDLDLVRVLVLVLVLRRRGNLLRFKSTVALHQPFHSVQDSPKIDPDLVPKPPDTDKLVIVYIQVIPFWAAFVFGHFPIGNDKQISVILVKT